METDEGAGMMEGGLGSLGGAPISSAPIQDGRLLVLDTSLGRDVFLLEKLEGFEALSTLFRFELRVRATREDVAPDELIGRPVGFSLELPAGSAGGDRRHWCGIVTELSADEAVARGRRAYTLVVRPWTWLLTQTSDCRIFQDMTSLEIMRRIFTENGFQDFDFGGVINTPPKRDYCVQYRETDFDFVARLMEEDGLFWTFRHREDAHLLVVADGVHAYRPAPDEVLRFAPTDIDLNGVIRWDRHFRFVTGAVARSDYDYEAPEVDLAGRAGSVAGLTTNGPYEIYDWHGRHLTPESGRRGAARWMAAIESDVDHVEALATNRCLAPGDMFTLTGHPSEIENGSPHVVTAVSHRASAEGYEVGTAGDAPRYAAEFRAIPAATRYVTPETTPRPTIDGVQTATVVGPKGEEIHTDRYGRIKVRFPWDRYATGDDRSSCWIRVMQPWGGRGMGVQTIPRIGMEVMVAFIEGDPDRPLVVGTVPNAETMPPLTLPATKTRTSFKSTTSPGGGGFNELSFEDLAGAEELLFRAERDHARMAGRNRMINTANVSTEDTNTLWGSAVGNSEVVKTRANVLIQHVMSRIILDGERVRFEHTNGHFFDLSAEGISFSSTNKLLQVRNTDNFIFVNKDGVVRKGKVLLDEDAGGTSSVTISADGVGSNGPVVMLNCGPAYGDYVQNQPATPGTEGDREAWKAEGEAWAGTRDGDGGTARVMGGEGSVTADDGRVEAEFKGGGAFLDGDLEGEYGSVGGKLNVLGAEGKGHAGVGYGAGAYGEARASMIDANVRGALGDLETGGVGGQAEYRQMAASAKGEILLGDDGRRAGLALGGMASASALEGGLQGDVTIPIGWLPWVPDDYTINLQGRLTGAAGTVAASAGGFGYYDYGGDGRVHGGAYAKLGAILGAGVRLKGSIGPSGGGE
ncbi:type VI secretion system tip protein TssI/VgrG (plasmid) [Tistrella mobilis]|nr:type VI secretion system tip protein TssI/VgrG [Tistrella mobilis]